MGKHFQTPQGLTFFLSRENIFKTPAMRWHIMDKIVSGFRRRPQNLNCRI